jgi:hypothetical protein
MFIFVLVTVGVFECSVPYSISCLSMWPPALLKSNFRACVIIVAECHTVPIFSLGEILLLGTSEGLL